jgi:hypothetical protein
MINTKESDKPFAIKDFVCCEILEITEQPQLILGMLGKFKDKRTDHGPQLGSISSQQFPFFYQ